MRLPSIRLAITLGAFVVCAVLAATQLRAQPAAMSPLGTPLPAVDEKIQEVADAQTRFRSLDFSGALELLREAVKKHPDRLPPAQVVMALWYSQVNQGAAALGSFEMAIVEDPDNPEAYIFLGDSEFQGSRVTAAGLLYDKAYTLAQSFEKSPKRKKGFEPRIYAGLAAVAESRAAMSAKDKDRANKEWVAAQGHLESWLKLDPDSAIAMQRLARALFKQGSIETDRKKAGEKLSAALEKLKEAWNADPNVLTPHATMAKFYQEEDDFDRAKEFMTYALQKAPKNLRTRLEAARWCLQTSLKEGQLDQAREHAIRAIRLDEKSLDAMILRGVVALFQKEYETAERYFLSAVLREPNNLAATNNLALAYCEQQDETKKRQAQDYAQRNAQLYRNSVEAASTLGWVLYKRGRIADADKRLGELVRRTRVSDDTLYYAARVATDRSRPAEAMQLLQRALDRERPFPMRPEAEALLVKLREAKRTGSR